MLELMMAMGSARMGLAALVAAFSIGRTTHATFAGSDKTWTKTTIFSSRETGFEVCKTKMSWDDNEHLRIWMPDGTCTDWVIEG